MDGYQFPNNKPSRLRRQKRRDKRLHEEVIECRRRGGGDTNKVWRTKGHSKRRQQEQRMETEPFRSSIREGDVTSFDDNLEPLLRYLQQNVGRPWDDVYSELCQQLDRSSVTGLHVFQHLERYITPWYWEQFRAEDYTARKTGVGRQFRIHPDTGILLNEKTNYSPGPYPKKARYKKEKERRKARRKFVKPVPPRRTGTTQAICKDISGVNRATVKAMLSQILFDKKQETRRMGESFGPFWSKLAESPFSLYKKNDAEVQYTFHFQPPEFGRYHLQNATDMTFPAVILHFRVSCNLYRQHRRFICTLRTSGERGWPTNLVALECL